MPTGLLLVDKPQGLTSHDVVARARRALGTRKVGHAGTLDPMATGLLTLGAGSATRLLTYLVGLDKTYETTMRLGVATTTDDAEGEVVSTADPAAVAAVTDEALAAGIRHLTGEIDQRPSSVSAIKVDDGPLSAPLDPHQFPIPDIWSDLALEESPYIAAKDWRYHNSEGESDSEQHRRLARKIRYRTMAHNGTEKDLFSINRKGGNDLAWKLAVEVLNVMRVMDIEEITTEFVGERERFCYARRRSVNMERYCALYDCDKPTEALFPGLHNVSVRAIRGRGKSKGVATVANVPADTTRKGGGGEGVGEQKHEEED